MIQFTPVFPWGTRSVFPGSLVTLAVSTEPRLTTDVLVVLAVVALALVLFVTERLPVDVTAILLMVVLTVLQPWTTISPTEAISGFANEATITVLAMLILSAGISKTGLVQELGRRMADFAGGTFAGRFSPLSA